MEVSPCAFCCANTPGAPAATDAAAPVFRIWRLIGSVTGSPSESWVLAGMRRVADAAWKLTRHFASNLFGLCRRHDGGRSKWLDADRIVDFCWALHVLSDRRQDDGWAAHARECG